MFFGGVLITIYYYVKNENDAKGEEIFLQV